MVGVVLAGALVSFGLLGTFRTDSSPRTAATTAVRVGVPARLEIPKIRVNAAVEQTGLTRQGLMGVPKDPDNAAWYKHGPRPGETGSAVIDGHFDWDNGTPAVFDDLRKLRPGDKVMVTDRQGTTISFTVRKSRNYSPEADATSVFRSSDGKAHLNLITCTGVWNQGRNSYSQRLVVFSDRE